MLRIMTLLVLLTIPAYAMQECNLFGCYDSREPLGSRLLNHPLLDRRDRDWEPRDVPDEVECRTQRCEFYESCVTKTVCQ